MCLLTDVKPTAIFPLDECHSDSNNMYDISGNGLTGERPADGPTFTYGPSGNPTGSTQFAGSSSNYLEIARNDKTDTRNSITIMATIFPTKETDGPIIYYTKKDQEGNDMEGVSLRLRRAGLQFRLVRRDTVSAVGETAVAENVITLNAWNFIVATYDSKNGTAKLYVNSSLVKTFSLIKRELATNGRIRVGAVTGDDRYFFGKIACLQIFSSSLSQEQIAVSENCPIRK